MDAKPILRVGKLKRTGPRSLTAVDNHLSRTSPTHNADPRRTPGNVWLVGGPGTLADQVGRVMAKAGIDATKLRKDATVANDVLLTISPTWFRPDDPDRAGTWDPRKVERFRKEALAFLREQFGPRLAVAVMHLDESTPHVQAVVVPVMPLETRPEARQGPSGGRRLSGRDYFGPDRLRGLQDAWEARMAPHGVGPRLKGSKARHTTIKRFYSALAAAPPVPDPAPPSPPPVRALLPGGAAALTRWQDGEVKRAKKRTRALEPTLAKGMLYEAEKRAGDAARESAARLAARVADMRQEVAQATQEAALSKEEVARLRGVPVAEVAAALDYTGEVGRRENAIDLVRRVGGLDFAQATRWLACAFGPAAAGAAARAAMAVPVPAEEVPLTKADQVKAREVRKQLDALDAREYRLTVQHEEHGVNFGKRPEGEPERFWTRDEVVAFIPRLTAENARGGQVYVTPIDPLTHYPLVDDMRAEDVAAMKAKGYAFATLTETSPGNHQGVVKILKAGVREEAVNEWFKATNREHGDERITGLRHPFRLAGFQNRKAKYEQDGRFPFVRLVEATRTFCRTAQAAVREMAREMAEAARASLPRPR